MNMRRGHESHSHLEAKKIIGRLFDDSAWSVFIEERNADLIILHHASRFVVGIEVESSPRNVLNNIVRNIAFGCHAVAIVSLTERYLDQITNKILNHIESHEIKQVRVFTYDESGLAELHEWIADTAHQLTHRPNHFLNNHKPKEKDQ